jgi:hypothetical protein
MAAPGEAQIQRPKLEIRPAASAPSAARKAELRKPTRAQALDMRMCALDPVLTPFSVKGRCFESFSRQRGTDGLTRNEVSHPDAVQERSSNQFWRR